MNAYWNAELRAMKTAVAGAVGANGGDANLTDCGPLQSLGLVRESYLVLSDGAESDFSTDVIPGGGDSACGIGIVRHEGSSAEGAAFDACGATMTATGGARQV